MEKGSPIPLKRSRSQHFLKDAELLRYEAEKLRVKGEKVLEIGAGDGRLSAQVLRQEPARLTLVELDPRFADSLRKRFAQEPRVEVREGDFLELDDQWRTPLIIGNIPYQITSPIMVKLCEWMPKRALLCVQKEVAQRVCAKAGTERYGRLSVMVQAHFKAEFLGEVNRSAFEPPPNVDSAFLLLSAKKNAKSLPPHFEIITAALFSHRLQTISGALVHERRRWGWSKEEARERALKLKIDARKVMHYEVEELVEMARRLPLPKE